MQRNLMITAVFLFITLALTPYGVVAEMFPTFGSFVDSAFSSWLSHVIGHFALFVVMGTAVLLIFPKLQHHPKAYFLLMATLGFLQEFLQITTFKHRPIAFDDILDFVIDMLGAAFIYFVITQFFSPKEKSAKSFDLRPEVAAQDKSA